MDDIVGQVSRGTQQQKEAVNQSTLTVDQISESIQQVTRNAKIGTQGAAQAAEIARKGVSIVEANLEGMYRIKNKVDLSTTRIQEMSDWSIQIGTIIETINNLASQTNLLALNAAIEAARAGEHGKGFAVVADEVRKLAEKSTQSTKEIASLIYGIQETANEAVTAMGEGSKEVDEGVALANEAGQALSEILQASEAVHEQVERIAVAAQEMDTHSNNLVDTVSNVSAVVEENVISVKALTAGFNEVHTAVNSVVSISQENSASAQEVGAAVEQISAQVEEISASAQYLNKMSLELQILTNKFQLTAEDENFVVPTEEQEKNNLIEDWYKKLPLAISE
jgi:methyl-accepting chemotaxis protein